MKKEGIVSSSGRSIVQHCSIPQKMERVEKVEGAQPPPIEDEGVREEAHDDDGHHIIAVEQL